MVTQFMVEKLWQMYNWMMMDWKLGYVYLYTLVFTCVCLWVCAYERSCSCACYFLLGEIYGEITCSLIIRRQHQSYLTDCFKSLSLDFLSFQITVHLETWIYPYCTDTAWAFLCELAYIHTVAYNPGPNCKISVYWEISHMFYFTTIIHEGVLVSRVESGGEF